MADPIGPQLRLLVTRADARVNREVAAATGSKTYAGRPCKHGHDGKRYVNGRGCVACCIAQGLGWKKDNHGLDRLYSRQRYAADPAAQRAASRKSRAKNRDAYRAADRARYAADAARQIADSAAWNLANKARVRANAAARRAANPEPDRVKSRSRYALKCSAEGKHTAQEILALLQKQRGKCANCLRSIKDGYHADHIKALKRGGSNWITNIQLLCPTCNQRKHAKDPFAFALENGRLL